MKYFLVSVVAMLSSLSWTFAASSETLPTPSSSLSYLKIPILDQMKVSYSVIYSRLRGEFDEKNDSYSLDIEIPKIDRESHKKLVTHFGAQSQVPFKEEQRVRLSDFLSPKFQAVLGHSFKSRTRKTTWSRAILRKLAEEADLVPPSQAGNVTLETNCYSTAWEVLRRDSPLEFSAWWAPEGPVRDILIAPDFGINISKNEASYGDLLFFEYGSNEYDSWMLNHVAVIIDGDLCFEKTDTIEPYAYRLAQCSHIVEKYKEAAARDDGQLGQGDELKITYLRPKSKISAISELLSVESQKDKVGFYEEVPANERRRVIFGMYLMALGGTQMGFSDIEEIKVKLSKSGRGQIDPLQPLYKHFVKRDGTYKPASNFGREPASIQKKRLKLRSKKSSQRATKK